MMTDENKDRAADRLRRAKAQYAAAAQAFLGGDRDAVRRIDEAQAALDAAIADEQVAFAGAA